MKGIGNVFAFSFFMGFSNPARVWLPEIIPKNFIGWALKRGTIFMLVNIFLFLCVGCSVFLMFHSSIQEEDMGDLEDE